MSQFPFDRLRKKPALRWILLSLLAATLFAVWFATTTEPPVRQGNLLGGRSGWFRQSWQPSGKVTWDSSIHHGPGPSIRITAAEPNDLGYGQRITVYPGRFYRFTAWVKTREVEAKGDFGANLSVYHTFNHSQTTLSGNHNWVRLEQVFKAKEKQSVVFLVRLGFYGSNATGTAWFDQVTLEELPEWSGDFQVIELIGAEPKASEWKDRLKGNPITLRLFNFAIVIPYLLLLAAVIRQGKIPPGVSHYKPPEPLWRMSKFWWLSAAAIVVRLVIAPTPGFVIDTNLYKYWALDISDPAHPMNIYRKGVYVDYPPLYMYALGLVGWLARILGIEADPVFHGLLKAPSIIADLVIGCLLLTLLRRFRSDEAPWWLAALFWFNPVVLMDSVLWGQTDALYAALLLAALWLVGKQKPTVAGMMLATAFALKPQSAYFIIFFVALLFRFHPWRLWFRVGLSSLATFVVIILPFAIHHPPTWIFELYAKMAGTYNLLSFNAYNLWALLGFNELSGEAEWLGLPLERWALFLSLGTFVLIVFLGLRAMAVSGDDPSRMLSLFRSFTLLSFCFFMLAPRMHERYLYPAVVFMLPLFLSGMRYQWCYLVMTAAQYLNLAYVFYFHVYLGHNPPGDNWFIRVTAASLMLVFLILLGDELGRNLPGSRRLWNTLTRSIRPWFGVIPSLLANKGRSFS